MCCLIWSEKRPSKTRTSLVDDEGCPHTTVLSELSKDMSYDTFCFTYLSHFGLSADFRLESFVKEYLDKETHALNYREVPLILLQQLSCMGDTSFLDPQPLIGRIHFQPAFKIKAQSASVWEWCETKTIVFQKQDKKNRDIVLYRTGLRCSAVFWRRNI